MLVDLTPIISHGIIDNTTQGVIELELWCERETEPLQFKLWGNCLQDIAGCRVSFKNNRLAISRSVSRQLPLYRLADEMRKSQEAMIPGDITLSRRAISRLHPGQRANMLSIELFFNTDARILIESEDFEYELSLPEWECSSIDNSVQRMINLCNMREHIIANVASYQGPALAQLGEGMPPCRWDNVLNRAEAYMAIAPFIRDKYASEPDCLLYEAFVLDRPDILGAVANDLDRGVPFDPVKYASGWEILDFVPNGEAERISRAMSHPLFEATAALSVILQRHIISHIESYRSNPEVEEMVSQFAGIISQMLSTILTAQDEDPGQSLALALERATALGARLEKLRFCHKVLQPHAASKFMEGLNTLISELKAFVCTLRP